MSPDTPDQNQQPVQPEVPSQPPVSPEPSVTPPAPEQPVQPAYAPAPAPQQAKSKKGLIIALAIGIPLLIILPIILLVVFAILPGIQSAGAANAFMADMTSGNVNAAVTASGDESAREFLTASSAKLKGNTYKLTNSEYNRSGDSYYLFALSGGDYKSARVIVGKEGAITNAVKSFVYDVKVLALKPGSAAAVEENARGENTQTTQALACLSNDDYKYMTYDKSVPSVTYDTTYDPAKYTINYTANMFFKPDTTNEDSFTSIYDDWADFANRNTDKQWVFHLEGSIYGTNPADQALAKQRAEKVKSELTNRGVPASRIVIDAPHDYSNESQESRLAQIFRRVQVVIDPTCTGAASSGVGR